MVIELGKLGEYPRGKLNNNDEGVLNIGLFTRDKTLIINFGTEVTWIGLDKEMAIDLAISILQRTKTL